MMTELTPRAPSPALPTTPPGLGRRKPPVKPRRQSVVHWPIVAIAAGLATLFVVGLIVSAAQRRHVWVAKVETPVQIASAPVSTVATANSEVLIETRQARNDERSAPLLMPVLGPVPETKPAPKLTTAPPVVTPVALVKAAPQPPAMAFKQRKPRSPDELCRALLAVSEVNLDTIPGSSVKLLAIEKTQQGQATHLVPELLAKRPDLSGLPMRMGYDCQLGKESAENLQVLSRKLRVYLSQSVPNDGIDTRIDAVALRKKLLEGNDGARKEWLQAEAVPALVQLLQAEERPLRVLLVELL